MHLWSVRPQFLSGKEASRNGFHLSFVRRVYANTSATGFRHFNSWMLLSAESNWKKNRCPSPLKRKLLSALLDPFLSLLAVSNLPQRTQFRREAERSRVSPTF